MMEALLSQLDARIEAAAYRVERLARADSARGDLDPAFLGAAFKRRAALRLKARSVSGGEAKQDDLYEKLKGVGKSRPMKPRFDALGAGKRPPKPRLTMTGARKSGTRHPRAA